VLGAAAVAPGDVAGPLACAESAGPDVCPDEHAVSPTASATAAAVSQPPRRTPE